VNCGYLAPTQRCDETSASVCKKWKVTSGEADFETLAIHGSFNLYKPWWSMTMDPEFVLWSTSRYHDSTATAAITAFPRAPAEYDNSSSATPLQSLISFPGMLGKILCG
jgi:hypothetical protein